MIPSAPGRVSTTTDCFQRFDSSSASTRAVASIELPAASGPVRIRTGCCGQLPANEWASNAKAASRTLVANTRDTGLVLIAPSLISPECSAARSKTLVEFHCCSQAHELHKLYA